MSQRRLALFATVFALLAGCRDTTAPGAYSEAAELDRIAALPAMPVWIETADAPRTPSADVLAFMDAAAKANAIADPLARCLAFPDLPGNAWPAGLARAHCELGHGPRIRLDDVRALLDSGDTAQLEARYTADLERHFAREPSEAIHRDFDDFDASDAADDVSERWLAAVPFSAYAHMARARHLLELGSVPAPLRPPDRAVVDMKYSVDRARPLLERAVAIEPRLLPAYRDQIGIAQFGADQAQATQAYAAASKHDPWCRYTTAWHIAAYSPRSGGSYAQMDRLAATLAPHVAQRPLLALGQVWPDYVRGTDRGDGRDGIDILATIPLRSTHPEPYLSLVDVLEGHADADPWQVAMLLMETDRFETLDRRRNHDLMRRLLELRPEMATYYGGRMPAALSGSGGAATLVVDKRRGRPANPKRGRARTRV